MTQTSTDYSAALDGVSTATITMVLLKMGIRNVWIRGAFPLRPDQERIAGPAFTLRFIPAREDLATPEALASPRSSRAAIEEMPSGCVAVIAADGCVDAGVLGDILCERMRVRGVRGMVSDGVVRDLSGVLDSGLCVWAAGTAAPASATRMTFADWQMPIGCGGVAIFPGDLIVADRDGAVVIPQKLIGEVIPRAREQEALEEWIIGQVRAGGKLTELYPPSEENRRRYEAYRDGLDKDISASQE